MTLKEHTLDLVKRVEEMDERFGEIEEEKDKLQEKAVKFKEENGADEPLPDKLENRWSDLDGEEIELSGEREKMVETVVSWCTDTDITEVSDEAVQEKFGDVDTCQFVVKELTFGQLQGVSDDMMDASFEVDVERQDIQGTPKQGFYQIELLRESIISQPSGAPTVEGEYDNEKPEPAEYPVPVGEWLFEKVDALNTSGDTKMGNSSLEETIRYGR